MTTLNYSHLDLLPNGNFVFGARGVPVLPESTYVTVQSVVSTSLPDLEDGIQLAIYYGDGRYSLLWLDASQCAQLEEGLRHQREG